MKASQQRVLTSLLTPARFTRLVEQEAIDGAKAYRPTEFMRDVRTGIWKEIEAPKVAVNPYRRNLQRVYLELLGERLNGRQALTDDQRPIIRGELRDLDAALKAAVPRAVDRATQLHLQDARDQVAKILDPKFSAVAPAAGAAAVRPGLDDNRWPLNPDSCWPDYIIRPPKK